MPAGRYLTVPDGQTRTAPNFFDARADRGRPYGFWGPVARMCSECRVTDQFARDLRLYGLALTLSMSLLFGMGLLLLGSPVFAIALLALGAGAGWLLVRAINSAARATAAFVAADASGGPMVRGVPKLLVL